MTALYLQAYHHFLLSNLGDKSLRQQLKQHGIDGRRMARFTQLALLGALPLRDKIHAQTAIYLASPYSSPSQFNAAFFAIHQHNMPSPLDFMANTHNAAVFHLAQICATNAETLFLSIDANQYGLPICLAWNHFLQYPNQQVLVGWAFEKSDDTQQEGSCWWLLSNQADNALATIRLTRQPQTTIQTDTQTGFLSPFTQYEQIILQKKQLVMAI